MKHFMPRTFSREQAVEIYAERYQTWMRELGYDPDEMIWDTQHPELPKSIFLDKDVVYDDAEDHHGIGEGNIKRCRGAYRRRGM